MATRSVVAYAEVGSVESNCGSIAIGGAALGNTFKINGTVVCGIPPEKIQELIQDKTRDLQELSASRKQTISLLEKELDLNQRQVRSALEIVGEANVPPERLSAKLIEVAERFKALQVDTATQPEDDRQTTVFKADAQKAVDAGDLSRADSLLAKAQATLDADTDRLSLNAAEITAQRGRLALTRLRYDEAARYFATAAARLPSVHAKKRLEYLEEEAEALYRYGDERGNVNAARTAIERYRQLVALKPRELVPFEWAEAQNNLAFALQSVGRHYFSIKHLEEAIQARRSALQEFTREHDPLKWASVQNNLGNDLQSLGLRSSNQDYLNEAIELFQNSLQEYTPDRVPLSWATAQNNLGVALDVLDRSVEAIESYQKALTIWTRGNFPWNWAMVQNNLGTSFHALARKQKNTIHIRHAIEAFHSALHEWIRDKYPMDWALSQHNLGYALGTLFDLEGDTKILQQSIEVYRKTLFERTRESTPYEWAWTQNNLGISLYMLDNREGSTARLVEAIECLRNASLEWTLERSPTQWAVAQYNLANALRTLGESQKGTDYLEQAIVTYNECLKVVQNLWPKDRVEVLRSRRDRVEGEVVFRKKKNSFQ